MAMMANISIHLNTDIVDAETSQDATTWTTFRRHGGSTAKRRLSYPRAKFLPLASVDAIFIQVRDYRLQRRYSP